MESHSDDAEAWLRELLPDCNKRDVLLDYVRTGAKFKGQQSGKKRGAVFWLVHEGVHQLETPTFERLIDWLHTLAVRNDPRVYSVDGLEQVVVLHVSRDQFREVSFGRLRNILTDAKKYLFTDKPKP